MICDPNVTLTTLPNVGKIRRGKCNTFYSIISRKSVVYMFIQFDLLVV